MRAGAPAPARRFEIVVYPIIEFPSLGLTVRTGDISVQVGVLLVLCLAPRLAEALTGVDRRRTRLAIFVLAMVGLIGGRLHFLLNHWRVYSGRPLDALAFWEGSFHIPGVFIAVVLAAPFVTRRFGLPLGRFGDGIAPTIGLGIAVVRLGCFLQSCCYGRTCEQLWCIPFPRGSQPYEFQVALGMIPPDAPQSLPVHPLQLYFLAVGLLIFLGGLWLVPRRRYDGQVALLALLVFSLGAAGFESFRADHYARTYWGPLPQLQWTGMAMTLVCLVAVVRAELAHRRTIAAVPATA